MLKVIRLSQFQGFKITRFGFIKSRLSKIQDCVKFQGHKIVRDIEVKEYQIRVIYM